MKSVVVIAWWMVLILNIAAIPVAWWMAVKGCVPMGVGAAVASVAWVVMVWHAITE